MLPRRATDERRSDLTTKVNAQRVTSPIRRLPDAVTSAIVAQVLGDGSVETLPPPVREAIASERWRLSTESEQRR